MLKKLFFIILILSLPVFIFFYYSKKYQKNVVILIGEDKIPFKTSLNTVAEVINEANITLNKEDLLIPSYESPLTDNICIKIIKAKPVFILVDNKILIVKSHKNTVRELLHELCIEVNKGDKVKPSLEIELKKDSYNYISIKRGISITIIDGNKQARTIKSTRNYVSQVLQDEGIGLNLEDRVSPPPDTLISPGIIITITRIICEIFSEEETIPYDSITREDDTLEDGYKEIVQEGKDGIVKNTLEIYYKNNELTREKIISRDVLSKPVDEIILIGTKIENYVSPQVSSPSYSDLTGQVITMEATAYGPLSGYTSTGMKSGYGVCAVDPSVIPLGTKLYIEGYGNAIAADTGPSIWGYKIDLCFNTRKEALRFGKKTVTVHILN